jgi:hypothetical protein
MWDLWWTIIIFITGLHNKLQGCGESVASAAGPFTTKKMLKQMVLHVGTALPESFKLLIVLFITVLNTFYFPKYTAS